MSLGNRYLFVGTNGLWPELEECLKYAQSNYPASHYICSPAVEDTLDLPGWHIVPTVWMWNAARQWNEMFGRVADVGEDAILTFIWLRNGATPAAIQQLSARLKGHTPGICLVKHATGILVAGSLTDFAKLSPAKVGKGFFDEHVGNYHLLQELHTRAMAASIPVLDPTDRAAPYPPPFGQQEQPLLSACLICKDGAVYLAQCLESLIGAVDDVVIVLDTSTTDDTAAIAERYGARVIHRQWDSSFANARNVSLRAARGRWALWIDADEVLQPGQAPLLRQYLSNQSDVYLSFCHFNYAAESEATGSKTDLVRLAPNRETIYFAGTVHELPTGEELPLMKVNDITILHYGYMEALSRTKLTRNHTYLLAEWEKNPADPRLCWYLGGSYLAQNKLQQAIAVAEAAPQGMTPWHLLLMHLQAELYHQVKRSDVALTVLERILASGSPFPAALVLRGHIYLHQRRLTQAKDAYETALSTPYDTQFWGSYPVGGQDYETDCRAGLALVAFHSGDPAEAERLLQMAISKSPSAPLPHLGMSDVLTAQGRLREALEHLNQARKRATQGLLHHICVNAARLYVAMGEPRKAYDQLASENLLQENPLLVARIAELEGNWAEARKLWDDLVQTTGDPLFIAHRALCAIRLRDLPVAVADLEQIMPAGELITPYGYVPMAMLAELNGNYGEAYQYLREGYGRCDREVDILLYLGRMAYLAGNVAEALNAARAILSVNPELPDAVQLYHLTGTSNG